MGGLISAKFSRRSSTPIVLFTPESAAGEKSAAYLHAVLQEFDTYCGFELVTRNTSDPVHRRAPRSGSPIADSARMCVQGDPKGEGTGDIPDAVAHVTLANSIIAGANVVAPNVATVPVVVQADDDVGVDDDLVNTADTPVVGEQHHCCENCNVEHSSSGNHEGAFCTEGTQGFWESVVAMVTLGTVSNYGPMMVRLSCSLHAKLL